MAHLHYRSLISVFLGSLLFAKSCCGKYIDDSHNTNHSNTYWATCAVHLQITQNDIECKQLIEKNEKA